MMKTPVARSKTVIEEKYPMISYDSWIDMFVLDTPDGERKYFRDYEGAEGYFLLNYRMD